MASRIKIHEEISGKLLQHEEWWFLVPGKDGMRHVMLERYSIDPSRKTPAKVVRKKFPVEKVLARGDGVAEALQAALGDEPSPIPPDIPAGRGALKSPFPATLPSDDSGSSGCSFSSPAASAASAPSSCRWS